MRTEITIAHEDADGRNYLTWAPVRATVRLLEPDSEDPVAVTLANEDPAAGGQLEFGTDRDQELAGTLELTLPADGSEVEFFVAGEFAKPSSADGDAVIQVRPAANGSVLSTKPVMVRVRKNANALTPAERDRFTTALATLNDHGRRGVQALPRRCTAIRPRWTRRTEPPASSRGTGPTCSTSSASSRRSTRA